MRIEQTCPTFVGVKGPNKEDAALRKACNDFESLLVGQVLKQMRQSIQKTELFGSREKEDMFQGMLDDEISKEMSTNHSIGIADVMYKQLSRQKTTQVPVESVEI
jgi:flagellar protein FlgJ